MQKKKMTVVFEFEDGAELPKGLTEAFASSSMEFCDTRITAISMDDEISRVEELEAELN